MKRARDDKRKHTRIPIDLSVIMKGPEVFQIVRGKDISIGGMFIESSHLEPEGSDVVLDFCLDQSNSVLNVHGEVMWVRPHSKEGEDGYAYPSGMGVRFKRMSPESRQKIEEHVEQC